MWSPELELKRKNRELEETIVIYGSLGACPCDRVPVAPSATVGVVERRKTDGRRPQHGTPENSAMCWLTHCANELIASIPDANEPSSASAANATPTEPPSVGTTTNWRTR